ncbi:hypothetical protein NL676_032613 [Syzygium grande]|nr:hypothetical protein NL676_032613 [Syzygium grande]
MVCYRDQESNGDERAVLSLALRGTVAIKSFSRAAPVTLVGTGRPRLQAFIALQHMGFGHRGWCGPAIQAQLFANSLGDSGSKSRVKRAGKGCQTEDGEMEVLSEMNVSDLGKRAFESQASVGVEREGSEQCSQEAGVHRLRIE